MLKKILCIAAAVLLLAGCGAPEEFETMLDVSYDQPPRTAATIELALPEEAAACFAGDPQSGAVYLCDGYTVTVATLPGGDLNATVRTVTGFDADRLQPIQLHDGSCKRYHCAWTAVGEGTEQSCRAVILDDGAYHYALTVLADADKAGKLLPAWQQLMDSFSLRTAP